VSLGGSVGSQDALPTATLLMPPAPNPTTRVSALAFSLAHAGRVDLAIYSVDGRKVRTLVAETREAGFHSVSWNGMKDDGGRAPAGVYFARMLTADGGKQTRVVTILGSRQPTMGGAFGPRPSFCERCE
jgi:flagellar hook assembly protein FlgD